MRPPKPDLADLAEHAWNLDLFRGLPPKRPAPPIAPPEVEPLLRHPDPPRTWAFAGDAPESALTDPDLEALARVWPALSPEARRALLTLAGVRP